jgi:hypothetical protein
LPRHRNDFISKVSLFIQTAVDMAAQDSLGCRAWVRAGSMDIVERWFFVAAATSLLVLIGLGLLGN